MNQMHNFFGGGGNPRQGGGGFNLPGPLGNAMNIIRQFKQFMQNPMSAFTGAGINIPDNIQGNPEAITNYLRNSGVMTEDQFEQATQFANMAQGLFGRKSQ